MRQRLRLLDEAHSDIIFQANEQNCLFILLHNISEALESWFENGDPFQNPLSLFSGNYHLVIARY